MKLDILDYDSYLFGYGVASLFIDDDNEPDISRQLDLIRSKNIKLLYINSKSENDIELPPGFEVTAVATRFEFVKALSETGTIPSDIADIHGSDERAYDGLLNLAMLSGEFSRFNRDRNLQSGEFMKLYSQWVDKSLRGDYADAFLVSPSGHDPKGLITLKCKEYGEAQIGLFAVEKSMQGHGLGKRLLLAAEALSVRRGFTRMRIPTQKENKQACGFYQSRGYSVDSIEFQRHVWIN